MIKHRIKIKKKLISIDLLGTELIRVIEII